MICGFLLIGIWIQDPGWILKYVYDGKQSLKVNEVQRLLNYFCINPGEQRPFSICHHHKCLS